MNHFIRLHLRSIKTILALTMIFFGNMAQAGFSNDSCQDDHQTIGSTDLQILYYAAEDTCYVSVHSNPNLGLYYRDFMVTNKGLFMVFGSFGPGSESTKTGAQEYFFPNKLKKNPIVSVDQDIITIKLTDEITLRFSTATGQITQITNSIITVEDTFTPENQAGVKITRSKSLHIDSGFALGKSPTAISKANSMIRKFDRSCQVKNSELFDYTGGGARLRYTNQEFESFVANKCPGLNTSAP